MKYKIHPCSIKFNTTKKMVTQSHQNLMSAYFS